MTWWPGARLGRTCGVPGFLRESSPAKAHALLDVVDEDGEIVATCNVPRAQAWRFIYRQLQRQERARLPGAPLLAPGRGPICVHGPGLTVLHPMR